MPVNRAIISPFRKRGDILNENDELYMLYEKVNSKEKYRELLLMGEIAARAHFAAYRA